MKKCNVGGQAVLEGVMMKAPNRMAIAVRRQDGKIQVKTKETTTIKDKYSILKFPVLRGIVTFGETMVMGVKSLMDSAELYGEEEEYKPSKLENWLADKTGKKAEDMMIFFALLIAAVFAVLLFMVAPALLVGFLGRSLESNLAKSLMEGVIRLTGFIIYIVLISRMKDIRRVFEYHGSEHKTIHCYEHGKELTVENAREFTTLHPRCGTAFLLIVMVISILAFSFLEWNNIFMRIGIKLLLLPLVAGVSYEIIKWAGASKSKWVGIIMYPGLMLQKLTTKEPDDEQLEVAICSFLAAMGEWEEQEETASLECNQDYESSTVLAP
ncbi:MAG TPA: DUF1385 domain-containing protein [Clostridia bacterium]|nr:DUF1385 domain-containing protein [Clostridia bacterium]